jgi:NitT/TauT family transport system permease protein
MLDALRPNRSVTGTALTMIWAAWALFALAAWTLGSAILLPSPLQILSALARLCRDDGLLYELVFHSMRVNLEALLLSTLISLALSYLTVVAALRPLAVVVGKARFLSLPGLIVVFTIAFGGGDPLKIALLTFGMTVFQVTSMASIVASIPRSAFDQARSLRMGDWRAVWEVVILGRASDAFEVTRQNAAMGWAMLTMVEGLVRSGGGVGVLMIDYGKHFQLDAVFAALLVVSVVGTLQDAAISMLQGFVCPYSRLTLERS